MAANTGARMPRADMNVLMSLSVVCPQLTEQRRIVDLLNHANSIRRLRREAQEKARQVIPALFVEMFGDPETIPKPARLGEVVEGFRYGTSQKSASTGLPTLRIPNVVNGQLDLRDIKTVPVDADDAERLRLSRGDLLIVRTNGNPDYVGRCAVFEPDLVAESGIASQHVIFASYLIRARPMRAKIHPHFLQAYLASRFGRRLLRERSRTSAGQYNINTEALRALPVPVPPLSYQQSFAERLADLQSIISQQDRMTAASEQMADALIAKVFQSSA